MVATFRNWNFDPNHTVAGADEDAQAQDEWFRFHEFIRGNVGVDLNGAAAAAGAWTVYSSSDGSATAGLGNNIASSADIIFDAGGSNHSWAVYTRVFGTRTMYLCVDWNDAATPFRSAQIVIFPGVPTVAGTLTNRPTHTNERILNNSTFHGVAGFVARTTHGWRSDGGDLLFVMSQDGTTVPETAIWVSALTGGEAATLWPVHVGSFHSTNVATGGALGASVYETGTLWDTFWQDDTPLLATKNVVLLLGQEAGQWTNGRSNISNAIGDTQIGFVWNSTTEAGFPGVVPDIRATPSNVPDNETQDGDLDLVRRITIGHLWVPHRAAAGALQL